MSLDVDDEETLVELGIALLERLEHGELSLAATMDRIEVVTDEPRLQRQIIDRAEAAGVIEVDRETGSVRPQSGVFLRYQAEVESVEGDFNCRRCGAGLETGHFIRLEHGKLGPFGSTCVRKLTGRE